MEDASKPAKPKSRWLIAVGVVVVLAVIAGAAGWWLSRGGGGVLPGTNTNTFAVPDTRNMAIADARKALSDANLKVEEEEEQVNDGPEDVVLKQEPAPPQNVRPGDTVKIVVAVPLKPVTAVSVGGYWDSTSNARYNVMQDGDTMFWSLARVDGINPSDDQGSATLSKGELAGERTAGKAMGKVRGRVVSSDDNGMAQIIRWDDGSIWFRTETDAAALVQRYHLERYDRSKIVDAIMRDRAAR